MSSANQKQTAQGGTYSYSYYRSAPRSTPSVRPADKPGSFKRALFTVVLVAAVLAGGYLYANHTPKHVKGAPTSKAVTPIKKAKQTTPSATPAAVNYCQENSLSQLILVSISKRHLWACAGTQQMFETPVVTGDTQYADTTTPPGTYHIYGKETDLVLTGSSSLGSWHDPVSYWMPFLDNQYGAYGFHDATWRSDSAFGNTDPSSSGASNGCVELPLASAKWLYDWSQVGTTVTIES